MMKSRFQMQFLLTVCSFLFVLACNKTTTNEDADSTVRVSEKSNSYPHAKNWALPENHGKAYNESHVNGDFERKSCLVCHGETNTANAPRCDSCHQAFPYAHTKSFMKGREKHKVLAESFEGKCLLCHRGYTENMPNMKEDGGCISCHDGQLKIEWKEDTPPTTTTVPEPVAPATTVAPNQAKQIFKSKKIKRESSVK